MSEGFCALPIIEYDKFSKNDYNLNLLEKYLISLRYFNDMKGKNHQNFGYLMQINQQMYKPEIGPFSD